MHNMPIHRIGQKKAESTVIKQWSISRVLIPSLQHGRLLKNLEPQVHARGCLVSGYLRRRVEFPLMKLAPCRRTHYL
jgi:hypothetical protein